MGGMCPHCERDEMEVIDWELDASMPGDVTAEFSCRNCGAAGSLNGTIYEGGDAGA